jgi:hypothetical protein
MPIPDADFWAALAGLMGSTPNGPLPTSVPVSDLTVALQPYRMPGLDAVSLLRILKNVKGESPPPDDFKWTIHVDGFNVTFNPKP